MQQAIQMQISKIDTMLHSLEYMISEVTQLRDQMIQMGTSTSSPKRRIEDAGYFGMWADREDMEGKTTEVWLDGVS